MILGLLFLDKGVLRKFPFSVRFILFVWLVICSFSNQDHPIRQTGVACCDNRPELKAHFVNWLTNYMSDSSHIFYDIEDTGLKKTFWLSATKLKLDSHQVIRKRWCPLTFVCAEGGALRTGAFSALALANIQDELKKSNFDFNNSIYAMSGVSGGALGLGYYNATAYLNKKNELHKVSEDSLAKIFLSEDYLSPTLGKLLFGEVINLMIPFRGSIEKFDRAVELEKSWEHWI